MMTIVEKYNKFSGKSTKYKLGDKQLDQVIKHYKDKIKFVKESSDSLVYELYDEIITIYK